MNIQEAKEFDVCFKYLLANTQGRLEQLIIDNKGTGDEVVTVTMDGGSRLEVNC